MLLIFTYTHMHILVLYKWQMFYKFTCSTTLRILTNVGKIPPDICNQSALEKIKLIITVAFRVHSFIHNSDISSSLQYFYTLFNSARGFFQFFVES